MNNTLVKSSILAGNLNLGLNYFIATVIKRQISNEFGKIEKKIMEPGLGYKIFKKFIEENTQINLNLCIICICMEISYYARFCI